MKCVVRRWLSNGQQELNTSGLSFVADKVAKQVGRKGRDDRTFYPKRRRRFGEHERRRRECTLLRLPQLTSEKDSAVIQLSHYSLFLNMTLTNCNFSLVANSVCVCMCVPHLYEDRRKRSLSVFTQELPVLHLSWRWKQVSTLKSVGRLCVCVRVFATYRVPKYSFF